MKILSASNFTGQIEIWCGHERRGWRPPPVGPARAGAPDRGEHLSSHSSQPSTVTKSHSTASALHTTQERPSTCLTLTACVSTPARRRALSSGALPRRIVPITLLLLLSLRRASSTHSLRPSAASGSTFHCRQVFTHTLPHPLPSCHTLPHPPPPHLSHFPHISPICHTPHSNSSPDNSFSILPQPDLRQQCYSEPPKRGEAGSLQWGEHHIFTLPNVDPQTISSGTLTIQLLEASLSRICHTPICLSRICHTPMCLSRICHTPICLTPIRQTPIGHTWHFSQPSLPH